MKLPSIPWLTGTLAFGTAACVQGQTPASTTPTTSSAAPPRAAASSAGLLNDWLRQEGAAANAWDLGGEGRARYEYREHFAVPGGADFQRTTPESVNDFLLLRAKFHVGYSSSCGWFGAFAEGRHSSSSGDKRDPNPQSDGPIDLHQAFVTVGHATEFPLTAKVGRQELSYGDERLVGAFDWDNIGRVFDAAKLRFQQEKFWVDAFVGRVVLPDDNNWNDPNWYDWFSGLYASTRSVIPRVETQLFLLANNVSQESPSQMGTTIRGSSPRDVYTAGTRFKSLPGQFKGWDFEGELAGQAGNFQYASGGPAATAGERLEHLAFAAHVAGGYTFAQTAGKPRLGLEYNFASGDDDPADDSHGTFVNLFPTNHKFYGYMDFVAWQNLHNPRVTFSISPLKDLTLRVDYHAFWLATAEDYFYQVNQAPRLGAYGLNPGAGSFVGQEVDFVATYRVKTYGTIEAGYGHFFTGEYVDDSLAAEGGSSDADWVYVQARVTF